MNEACDDHHCAISPGGATTPDSATAAAPRREILYVGDPMCSWCWGAAPALHALAQHALGEGLGFNVLVGGLRPGGGEAWTPQFRAFLRHHWQEVAARSGQPFRFDLLERPHFNYDTEPACRAVVVARRMLAGADDLRVLNFFTAVQRRFYAHNLDPCEDGFYPDLCAEQGLDHGDFATRFHSAAARAETAAEFQQVRALGVRGFPTVLLRQKDTLRPIANGYASAEALIRAVDATGA